MRAAVQAPEPGKGMAVTGSRIIAPSLWKRGWCLFCVVSNILVRYLLAHLECFMSQLPIGSRYLRRMGTGMVLPMMAQKKADSMGRPSSLPIGMPPFSSRMGEAEKMATSSSRGMGEG